MKNAQQKGDRMPWTNGTGSAVVSGQVVKSGHTLGIAVGDIADGATGEIAIEGVFSDIPKVTGAVFAQGEKLIWDVSAGKFDDSAATPASGDVTGGAIAFAAGTDGQTTCTIKLTPGNTTLTA
jgi:predicted RecA/RadA family phage recombinase